MVGNGGKEWEMAAERMGRNKKQLDHQILDTEWRSEYEKEEEERAARQLLSQSLSSLGSDLCHGPVGEKKL
jgi:hypothetical protein